MAPASTISLDVNASPAQVCALIASLLPSWRDAGRTPVVSRLSGGITNALLKVDHPSASPSSLLVRIFGPGSDLFIDRARDNEIVARLSDRGTAPPLYGLFSNGRVEGFISHSRALEPSEMSCAAPIDIAGLLAHQVALQHALVGVEPSPPPHAPVLWERLRAWARLAGGEIETEAMARIEWLTTILPSPKNRDGAALLTELATVEGGGASFSPSPLCPSVTAHLCAPLLVPRVASPLLQARIDGAALAFNVVFAHNDLLSGNVLLIEGHGPPPTAMLIDFEYAAFNYVGHDVGNCWCEHAGFLPFDLDASFPTPQQQRHFLRAYVKGLGLAIPTAASYDGEGVANGNEGGAEDAVSAAFLSEFALRCTHFALSSHLWWGLWAAIQAATRRGASEEEGAFDYESYSAARLGAAGWVKHRASLFPLAGVCESSQ